MVQSFDLTVHTSRGPWYYAVQRNYQTGTHAAQESASEYVHQNREMVKNMFTVMRWCEYRVPGVILCPNSAAMALGRRPIANA